MTGRPGEGFALGVDLGTSNTVAMLRWPDGRTRPLLFDGAAAAAVRRSISTQPGACTSAGTRCGWPRPSRPASSRTRNGTSTRSTVLLGDPRCRSAELFAAAARRGRPGGGRGGRASCRRPCSPIPAAWGPHRRAVLTDAPGAGPAGRRKPGSCRSRSAAARYFADVLRRPVPVGSALAVFDFGGGTLDVAVVRNDGLAPDGHPRFEVAASGGAERPRRPGHRRRAGRAPGQGPRRRRAGGLEGADRPGDAGAVAGPAAVLGRRARRQGDAVPRRRSRRCRCPASSTPCT